MPDTRFFRKLSRVDQRWDQPRKTFLDRYGPRVNRIGIRIAKTGRSMLWLIFILVVFSTSRSWATGTIVRDGGTLQLAEVTYRLDGIDAPAVDQMCIDDHADSWACGVDARDQLTSLIGGRPVHCEDLGVDPGTKKRHVGVCTVEGESASLNQLLVRQGFALSSEPSARGHFGEDATTAKDNRRGLWKGCFVAPEEFRSGRKDGALLGGSCRADKDREIRAALFPVDAAMPSGCSIKGKFALRARVTGNVGIYFLQACRSYPAMTKPDRWFCSEDDAQAAGFRRAYNCRSGSVRPHP
jgi:endonuclease YncB( thermonuclease family)